jgi:hypothetical protein
MGLISALFIGYRDPRSGIIELTSAVGTLALSFPCLYTATLRWRRSSSSPSDPSRSRCRSACVPALTRLVWRHDLTLCRFTLLGCEFPVVAFAIWGRWLRPIGGHVPKHMSYVSPIAFNDEMKRCLVLIAQHFYWHSPKCDFHSLATPLGLIMMPSAVIEQHVQAGATR